MLLICSSNWPFGSVSLYSSRYFSRLLGNAGKHEEIMTVEYCGLGRVSLQHRCTSETLSWRGQCRFMLLQVQHPQTKDFAEGIFILSWNFSGFISACKFFNRGVFFNIGLICKFVQGSLQLLPLWCFYGFDFEIEVQMKFKTNVQWCGCNSWMTCKWIMFSSKGLLFLKKHSFFLEWHKKVKTSVITIFLHTAYIQWKIPQVWFLLG